MRRQNRVSFKLFDRLDYLRGKAHRVIRIITLRHCDEDIVALDRICRQHAGHHFCLFLSQTAHSPSNSTRAVYRTVYGPASAEFRAKVNTQQSESSS
jgi:hypothetical protein